MELQHFTFSSANKKHINSLHTANMKLRPAVLFFVLFCFSVIANVSDGVCICAYAAATLCELCYYPFIFFLLFDQVIDSFIISRSST